jgi:hypothetical protein
MSMVIVMVFGHIGTKMVGRRRKAVMSMVIVKVYGQFTNEATKDDTA